MAVSDFRVYDTTEGWVSMGDVAADKVTLPVPSADGTVVLDSPAADTFTIDTGGTERLRVRGDGNVGLGYAGQANINFSIYNTFGISTVEAIGIMVASRFDGQPSQQCVGVESRPEFKGVVASYIRHFLAEDNRAGNQPFSGVHTGFCAADLHLSTTQNVGFETAQTGSNNLAFFASGSSPSQLNGGVRVGLGNASSPGYTFVGSENTGTFSPGADQWAVSTGGVERLRVTSTGDIVAPAGYGPATDTSLATKWYVDQSVSNGTTSTANVALTNPTRLGRFTPPSNLSTQEDANQAIGDAIAERSPVVVCTQVEYDNLTPDPETLYLING